MKTIVYLHGFASVGDSDKSRAIRERFPDCKVLSPDLSPMCFLEVMALLREHPGDEFVFVGTSLGGFWANVLAQLTFSPGILVNPSINPSKTLAGAEAVNYKTGDRVTVSELDISRFRAAEIMLEHIYTGKQIELFLAKDDAVLPFEPTLIALKGYNSVLITSDGGHRYTQHWDRVLDKIAELI